MRRSVSRPPDPRKAGGNPGDLPIVRVSLRLQAVFRTRGKDAPHDWPALPRRPLLLTPPQARHRRLDRRRRRARARRASRGRPHERRPHPAGHGLDQGDGRPRVEVARPGVRQQPARAPVEAREAHRQAEQAGRRRHGQEGQGHAARDRGGQPALRQGIGVPVEGQDDRLHPGQARRQPERPDEGRGSGRAGRGQAGREGRYRRVDRRLRGAAALEAGHPHQRGDRARRGRRDPAVRVRNGHGDGAADRDGDPRARQRPGADQHPRALHRRADRRADARHDDRPGRRDRLRALHSHSPQAAAARRHGDGGVDRARDGDRRAARSCSPARPS